MRKLAPMTKEEWERMEKERKVSALPDIELNRQMYSENSKKVKEEYNFVLSRSPPLTHVRMQYKTFRPPQGF